MPTRLTRLVTLAAGAGLVAAALAGCTAAPRPVATTRPVDDRGAAVSVAAFGGVSGQLLGRVGNGRSLQWLQVTDSGTAYSAVASGSATAALVGPRPEGWTPPAGGAALTTVGTVYRAGGAFYSPAVTSVAALADDATVAVPKDPAGLAAALRLLASTGVIALSAPGDALDDIARNSKHLNLVPKSAPTLAKAARGTDLVYLPADMVAVTTLPAHDRAVLTEPRSDQQAVSLVVRRSSASSSSIRALYARLTSASTRAWLASTLAGVTSTAD